MIVWIVFFLSAVLLWGAWQIFRDALFAGPRDAPAIIFAIAAGVLGTTGVIVSLLSLAEVGS